MQKIYRNEEYNFSLYYLDFIEKNKEAFIEQGMMGIERFNIMFPENKGSTTWNYFKYNLFSLTTGFPIYYELYKELTKIIRDYVGHNEPLWMQCWINNHMPQEVLDWHGHEGCICHGYVSIEPHNTKTSFKDYEINNKTGILYIGQSKKDGRVLEHKVIVSEPYTTPRITIAFDIVDQKIIDEAMKRNVRDIHISFIPI